MKAKLLALALGAAVAMPALAVTHVGDCGFTSNYSLSIKTDRLVFKRTSGTPSEVEIADGSLRIDGKLVATDAADTERLRHAEREIRAIVPEVKTIAREAIAIAFGAIGEVSAAFARDGDAARASASRIARAGRQIDRRIADSDSFEHWQDADVDALIESTVATLIPELIGNVAATAMKAAFSGDDAAIAELQARADGIERSVERSVEKQAADLGRRAMDLCPRLRALDRVESELDLRLADGSRLDLVRVD
ncbi:MAG: DUF2884 family protein [Rhodanobacteraceae bacterium]